MEAFKILSQESFKKAVVVFNGDVSNINFNDILKECLEFNSVEFDINNISESCLSEFMLTFLGWFQNANVDITLSSVNPELKQTLDSFGFLEMFEVIQRIKFPHKLNNLSFNVKHQKINKFLQHINLI